ncbi:hypothetical protein Syun_007581 [Stephania yunnanensis]|uniref:Uncharacterized protein n=1 Tax=Stephania yunnanensis TaxID=152371 RepID=A0AAP0KZS6_9MAGN
MSKRGRGGSVGNSGEAGLQEAVHQRRNRCSGDGNDEAGDRRQRQSGSPDGGDKAGAPAMAEAEQVRTTVGCTAVAADMRREQWMCKTDRDASVVHASQWTRQKNKGERPTIREITCEVKKAPARSNGSSEGELDADQQRGRWLAGVAAADQQCGRWLAGDVKARMASNSSGPAARGWRLTSDVKARTVAAAAGGGGTAVGEDDEQRHDPPGRRRGVVKPARAVTPARSSELAAATTR